MIPFLRPLLPPPCADPEHTNRIPHQRGLKLPPLDQVRNAFPVAPICDPVDFLHGCRHDRGQLELGHASIDERPYDVAFPDKDARIEGQWNGAAVRQLREMRKTLRIVQDAHEPQMIKGSANSAGIPRMKS
jgi:hypothetical protein